MKYYKNPDLYLELKASNLIPGMSRANMFGRGRYIDTKTQKWTKTTGIDVETKWVYTNPNPDLYCMYYESIFRGYGFVPQKCLNCYKVVVMPRTFDELLGLLDLQFKLSEENPKCWCKCGVEERPFVPRNYGGYFYTRSLEAGYIRYETVRDRVSKDISEDVPVILKRFCTEYELRFGPSNLYRQPEGADKVEKMFWDKVELVQEGFKQPDWLIDHIVQEWMIFANDRGDITVKDYNNGEWLFPPSVTYHGDKN